MNLLRTTCDLNVHEIDLNVLIIHSESIRIGFQEKNQLSFYYKDYATELKLLKSSFKNIILSIFLKTKENVKVMKKVNRSKLYKVHFGKGKFRFCYKKPPRKL